MKVRFSGIVLLMSILMLLIGSAALAQSGVTYGERITGQVNATQPQVFYSFTGLEGDLIDALVIGISPGMSPTLGLNAPTGQQVAFSTGGSLSAVSGVAHITYRLPSSGMYALQVGALPGAQGDYLFILEGGQVTPAELPVGSNVEIQLAPDTPQQVLMLTGTGDASSSTLFPFNLSGSGYSVHIFTASGETVALYKSGAVGEFSVGLAAGTSYYAVLTAQEEFSAIAASFGTTSASTSAPPSSTSPSTPPTTTTTTTADACTVVSPPTGVNVRSGPGTEYNPPIGSLIGTAPVTGQTGTGWYQISYNGQTGYVASSVVTLTGNCANVQTVTGPPPSQGTTTTTTSPTAIPTTTTGDTAPPTATTAGDTTPPTATPPPTQAVQIAPPTAAQLNWTLNRDSGGQFTGSVSNPEGNTSDRIRVTVDGLSNQPPNNFRQFTITLVCNGTNTSNLRWGTGGPSSPTNLQCGGSINITHTNDSNQTFININMTGGSSPGYVSYTLIAIRQ